MGIETRQPPIYFHASQTKKFRDGWDRIFGKKKTRSKPKAKSEKQTKSEK